MLGGGECWRAGNPGKKRSPGEGGEKIRALREHYPRGAGGIFTGAKKQHLQGGIELQKNWAPLGTHVAPSVSNAVRVLHLIVIVVGILLKYPIH